LDALASLFDRYNAAFIGSLDGSINGGERRLVLFVGHRNRMI